MTAFHKPESRYCKGFLQDQLRAIGNDSGNNPVTFLLLA
jgi:hypothetical protein